MGRQSNPSIYSYTEFVGQIAQFMGRQSNPSIYVCRKVLEVQDIYPTASSSVVTCDAEPINSSSTGIEQEKKVRKRTFGEMTLPARESFRLAKTMNERLEAIVLCNDQCPEDIRELTISDQNFVNKTVRPVVNCLKNHCNGVKEEFVKR
jgi:hypothetical protein